MLRFALASCAVRVRTRSSASSALLASVSALLASVSALLASASALLASACTLFSASSGAFSLAMQASIYQIVQHGGNSRKIKTCLVSELLLSLFV